MDKLLTANDLRAISTSDNNKKIVREVERILSAAKGAAEDGLMGVRVAVNYDQVPFALEATIIKRLTDLGFAARLDSGSDCRDGESWRNVVLSW